MSLGLVAYGSSDESEDDCQDAEGNNTVVAADLCSPPAPASDKSLEDSDVVVVVTKAKTLSSGFSGSISDDDEDGPESSKTPNSRENDGRTSKPTLLSLPVPKITKLHDIDFDWNQLTRNHKKSTQPIKISVPSLTDLDGEDEAEPVKKKLKPSKSGSGLFALLPSPKNQFGNQVPRQIPKPAPKKLEPKQSVGTSVKMNIVNSAKLDGKNKLLSVNYDDSPDEDEGDANGEKVDFFSLDTPVVVAAPDVPSASSVEPSASSVEPSAGPFIPLLSDKKAAGGDRKPKWRMDTQPNSYPASAQSTHAGGMPATAASSSYVPLSSEDTASSSSYIPFNSEPLELDQEALQQLCGRRERQKGAAGIQLIDVSGDAMAPDSREWLTKQLTEEQNTAVQSHKKKDGPTTQQRRKHQITYLAFQAKEHELELKNQWANNKMSRKQTQAKYGF